VGNHTNISQIKKLQKSRPRIKLWHQRTDLLIGLLIIIAAYGYFLLPENPKPSVLQWIGILIFIAGVLFVVAIITIDKNKPVWIGGSAGLIFLGILGWLFYKYSGAKWGLLGTMFFNKEVIVDAWPVILSGLGQTMTLFIVAALLAVITGPILAVIRSFNNLVFNIFIDAYVDVFRSMPILVLAIFIYYALPFMGIQFEPFAAGVWSLYLSAAAFVTEYFRAGIESVNRGHVEASRSLGFSALQTMRLVILPQAIRVYFYQL